MLTHAIDGVHQKHSLVKLPGELDEDAKGFDIVLGPETKRQFLGQGMASCLLSKGFCAVSFQNKEADDFTDSFISLKEMQSKGLFSRLPKETEKCLLGRDGRAKTMSLDFDFPLEESVLAIDENMTEIAETLVPFITDTMGCEVAERGLGMLCLSMSDEDEDQWAHPPTDDQKLLECYDTFQRGKIRMLHFLGPAAGEVTLQRREDAPLSGLKEEYVLSASANTILLVREDTFHYGYDEPDEGECAWLQCFLLEPRPEWELTEFVEEGVSDFFAQQLQTGPPPPTSKLVTVSALAIHAGANMMSKPKEWCAYTAGSDGHLQMPKSRFDFEPYYCADMDSTQPWQTYTKHFSVQEGVEWFDNKIFDISVSEAAAIDPMNRQTIEISYEMLVQKGYTKKWMNGNPTHASVSVGNDKQEWCYMPDVPRSVAANNQLAIAANRVNYIFNLKGGSYVMDTACSSSLVAAHLGKVNLLEHRWDPLAFHLAMGAGLTLGVGSFIGSCAAHMLSPFGRCLSFNASANGYNRGDGTCGIFMEAGDTPDRLAFFRGSQMGNDGRSASMSAPNGPAQEKCIWGAIREAQMRPPESTVWECHGTGTSLGDPIEVGAIRKVQIKEPRVDPLMVGTSKSNIGHLEGVAAVVGMVKCIVIVTKCSAIPTIHFRTLNPHLDHAKFEAIFCTEANPYFYSRGHCQVSSFGVGGTNGHGIFWGEDHKSRNQTVDYKKLFMQKISRSEASIEMDGLDPANWRFTGPGIKSNPGEKCKVFIEKDPVTGETTIRWRKVEDDDEDQGVLPPAFFSITGNFNDWSADKLKAGAVPGLHYKIVEVPLMGQLQFRFMAEDSKKRQLGPEENSSKRSAQVLEEVADCETHWFINDVPGVLYRIELMVSAKGTKAVSWSTTDVVGDAEDAEDAEDDE